MTILFGILRFAWPFILIGGLYLWADRGWCNSACQAEMARAEETEDERDKLSAEKAAAIKRASDLALLWADGLGKVEVRYVEQTREVQQRFTALRNRAGSIGGSGSISLADMDQRVLVDAHRGANLDPAVAGVDLPAAEALSAATRETVITPAEYAQVYVEGAEAYRDAYDKWAAAVAAYNALRQELPK